MKLQLILSNHKLKLLILLVILSGIFLVLSGCGLNEGSLSEIDRSSSPSYSELSHGAGTGGN